MAKVLYFVAGSAPSAEDRARAAKIGTTKFRNALLASGIPETCHAVAGAVPESYAHLPRADLTESCEPAPADEPATLVKPKPRGRRPKEA